MSKVNLANKIALVVGGICIGSGTTYLITRNKLLTKYDQILADEIRGIKAAADARVESEIQALKKLHKITPYDTPQTAIPLEDPEIYNAMTGEHEVVTEEIVEGSEAESFVDELLEQATKEIAHEVNPPSQAQKVLTLEDVNTSPVEIPTANIFESFKEGTIPQEVLRDKAMPYIISQEEYATSEYDQLTLLYYAGDETLADEQGGIVHDVKGVLGDAALNHFGYDEENPNTLFVRNDLRKADYEVIRLDGTHGELVLGIVPKD